MMEKQRSENVQYIKRIFNMFTSFYSTEGQFITYMCVASA